MKYTTKRRLVRAVCVLFLAMIIALFISIPFIAHAEEATINPPVSDITDSNWLKAYMNEAIIALCLAVGLLYKHCTPLDNRYIPLLVAVVGIGAAVVTHWAGGITMLVIVEGIWSGLASTGLHQMFTKLFIKAE